MRIIGHFVFSLSYLCSVKADIRQHPGFVYKSLNEAKNLSERKLTEARPKLTSRKFFSRHPRHSRHVYFVCLNLSFPRHHLAGQIDFLHLATFSVHVIVSGQMVVKTADKSLPDTRAFLVHGILQRIGDIVHTLPD